MMASSGFAGARTDSKNAVVVKPSLRAAVPGKDPVPQVALAQIDECSAARPPSKGPSYASMAGPGSLLGAQER